MRKLTIILSVLLTLTGVTTAGAQIWKPTNRATTLETGKQYMLYNASWENNNEDRTGFLFNNGSNLGHTGSPKKKPATFRPMENKYLWTIETTGEDYKYYIKSVSSNTYAGPAGATTNAEGRDLYIQPCATTQAPLGDNLWVEQADGTVIQKTNTDGLNGVFTITGAINGGSQCWNGNPDNFANWNNCHAFAFYEAEQIRSAEDVVKYNGVASKYENIMFELQSVYGLVTSADQMYSNAPQVASGTAVAEGSLAELLDGRYNTYFHSRWGGTAVTENHYLQIELPEVTDAFRFYFKKRESNNNNRPTDIDIMGSNDGTNFTLVTNINTGLPSAATELDYLSEVIRSTTAYRYYRFVVKATNNNQKFGDYPFFTFSEFYVLPDNSLVNEMIAAKATFDAITFEESAEEFDRILQESTAAYTKFENATKTVTLNHTYNGMVFETSTATALLGKTMTYTSNVTRPTLVCENPTQQITISEGDNVVTFTYRIADGITIPFETTESIDGTFPDDTKWYKLTIRNKYMRYESEDSRISNNSGSRTAIISADLFAFTGNPAFGYKIYNRAAGATKVLGGTAMSTNAIETMMTDGQDAPAFYFEINTENNGTSHAVFRRVGTQTGYLNDIQRGTSSLSKDYLGYWNSSMGATDAGSTFTFAEVTPEELTQILVNDVKSEYPGVYERMTHSDFVIGDDYNQYSSTTATAEDYNNAKTALEAAWSGTDPEALRTALAHAADISNTFSLNTPRRGTFLRMYSAANDLYVGNSTTAHASNNKISLEEFPLASTIFYYTPDGKLTNYTTGKSVALSADLWNWSSITEDQSSLVTFQESTSPAFIGKYFILSKDVHMYSRGTEKCIDRGAGIVINDASTAAEYTWKLQSVTSLPVTIGESGFATLWTPVALEIPEGVEAYAATLSDETVVLEQIEGIIPANTGVVLKAEAYVYYFNITEGGDAVTSGLVGSVNTRGFDKDTYTGKVYTLQIVDSADGTVGFKAYNGTQLSGFRARLETEKTMSAQALKVIFGETTGIEDVNTDSTKGNTVFDLSGRRVAHPAKGIYIINGKKVIFK